MKPILTFLLVFSLNAAAVAQHAKNHDKIDTTQMDVVLVNGIHDVISYEKIGMVKDNGIARLYRYSNSRVKKALSFKTIKDRPKLA